MIKKSGLSALLLIPLSGCAIMQGYVNQERVVYNDSANHDTKTDLVTYVAKVDQLLKVYDKENTTTQRLNLDSKQLAAQVGIETAQAEKIIKLVDNLDQINSQNYPILFTMFLGLNATPSNQSNRAHFWKSLDNLVNKTYKARRLEIEAQIKLLEAGIQNQGAP